jgi:3-oxoacyl-(acyl-carrier-protein) synthase
MDPRCRVAALAAAVALEESGFGEIPAEGTDRVFLWVATENGSAEADAAFWETARDEGGLLASPALFAATLPSSLAGEVARVLGLAGPAMVTAGAAGGELEAEALEAAAGTADLLLLLVVRGGAVPRVEAAALPIARERR